MAVSGQRRWIDEYYAGCAREIRAGDSQLDTSISFQ
jgi:hypothetical protein